MTQATEPDQVQYEVSTYAMVATGHGPELYARTEVWEPVDEGAYGALKLAGLPGLWRLMAVVGTIPDGATPINSAQHTSLLTQRLFEQEQRREAQRMAEAQRKADAYQALVNLNIPAELASWLSKHPIPQSIDAPTPPAAIESGPAADDADPHEVNGAP